MKDTTKLLILLPALLIYVLYRFLVVSEDSQASLQRAAEQLQESTESLTRAEAQLERDDRLISQLLSGWDRSAPVFQRQVDVTSYTSRPEETDSDPYITACNTPVTVGGIAVSRDLFDELGGCGRPLVLAGYGGFFVNDKMNARFTDTVDIWSGDLEAAYLHGHQVTTMMWQ